MIKEIEGYITNSAGKSALLLNHKVTNITYNHGSVQVQAVDQIEN